MVILHRNKFAKPVLEAIYAKNQLKIIINYFHFFLFFSKGILQPDPALRAARPRVDQSQVGEIIVKF